MTLINVEKLWSNIHLLQMTAGVQISINLVTPSGNLSYIISITNLMKLNEFEFMSNIKNHMILPMHYNYLPLSSSSRSCYFIIERQWYGKFLEDL